MREWMARYYGTIALGWLPTYIDAPPALAFSGELNLTVPQ
jgi:hypothetical protein